MSIQILIQRSGDASPSVVQADELADILKDPEACVWVDIEGRSPASDKVLSDIFGFHYLAIEDVYKEKHRPKIEDYDDYLYIIFRGLEENFELAEIGTIELDLFLGKNFVVTHHQGTLASIKTTRDKVRGADSKALQRGAPYLAHAVLDGLVDRFMPLGELYEREITKLEKVVLGGGDELVRIVDLKGGLQRIRRLVVAQRDLMGKLARAEFDEIPKEAKPYFRDVHEHLGHLTEQLDDHRVDLNAVFDAFHSLSAHHMNEIMKVLTLISTIMLPLTFLVGVYGMNFDQMPELHWKWGYGLLWAFMFAIAGAQIAYFRKRGWM